MQAIRLPAVFANAENSMFKNAVSPDTATAVQLNAILGAIQSDKYKAQVEALRTTLSAGEKIKYDEDKKKLPGLTFSGTFKRRDNTSLLKYVQLFQADFDHVENLEEVREKLKRIPHIVFVFTSPSGEGLKAAFWVDCHHEWHESGFDAMKTYLKEKHGLLIDETCKNLSRLCFVSHDPELWTNPEATPLKLPKLEIEESNKWLPEYYKSIKTPFPEQTPEETAERLQDALKYISAETYKDWIRYGEAIKNWNGPGAFDIWHNWSGTASSYKDFTDCQNTWVYFKPHTIDEKAVFKAATEAGWEMDRKKKYKVVAKNGVFERAETKSVEWQNPIPLVREEEEAQPYPVDDLGPIIGEAVKEFQNFGKQPISMVGSSALATASLCCQGLADVSRDNQNTSPISLSFLPIAESGERKTSTDKAFSKSLREWQRDKAEETKDVVKKSVAQHAAWDSERTGLLTAIREAKRSSKPINGKSLDRLKNDLESHELDEPEILYPPRLFFEDTNAEALAYFAAKGYPSFSLWSDEAGLTIGSHGMRDDRMMGFLALLNRLWDGGEFEPSRKVAKTAPIIGRRCTVNLMLQNSILQHWQEAGKGMTRGIGAFARFLILKPISTMGSREYQEPPEILPKMDRFHSRVREIMLSHPLPLNDQGQLSPPTLNISHEAKQEWIKQFNTIESALKPKGIFSDIPDFASKFGEQAARISGVLHIFENGPIGNIELETMQRAIRIAIWHIWEANLIFSRSALPPEFKDAILLLEWIMSQSQKSQKSQELQLTQVSVLHEGPNRLRAKKMRDAALRVLEDHQIVRLETVNRHKLIKVNPALTN